MILEAKEYDSFETVRIEGLLAKCDWCGDHRPDTDKGFSVTGYAEVNIIYLKKGGVPLVQLSNQPVGIINYCRDHHIDKGDFHNKFSIFQDGNLVCSASVSSMSQAGRFNSTFKFE